LIGTVGVAWAMAWRVPAFPAAGSISLQGLARYDGSALRYDVGIRTPGSTVVQISSWRGSDVNIPAGAIFSTFPEGLPRWSMVDRFTGDWRDDTSAALERMRVIEIGTGWPFRTMVSRLIEDVPGFSGRVVQGIAVPRKGALLPGAPPIVLPLRPIPAGFAASVLLIASPILIVTVIGAVRLRHRLRSGRCVSCGYDLRGGGGAACPECGLRDQPRAQL
jgi:hypothetical protein